MTKTITKLRRGGGREGEPIQISYNIPLKYFGGPRAEQVLRRAGIESVEKVSAERHTTTGYRTVGSLHDNPQSHGADYAVAHILIVRRHPKGNKLADFIHIYTEDHPEQDDWTYSGPALLDKTSKKIFTNADGSEILQITGGAGNNPEDGMGYGERVILSEEEGELIPDKVVEKAAKIMYEGLTQLLNELREEETILDQAAYTAATKPELGGALGVKDIPAQFHDAVGRLEAERGSRLVIERSRTHGEKAQFGAWYCMIPSVAPE